MGFFSAHVASALASHREKQGSHEALDQCRALWPRPAEHTRAEGLLGLLPRCEAAP
jgi:hypothetical protein